MWEGGCILEVNTSGDERAGGASAALVEGGRRACVGLGGRGASSGSFCWVQSLCGACGQGG